MKIIFLLLLSTSLQAFSQDRVTNAGAVTVSGGLIMRYTSRSQSASAVKENAQKILEYSGRGRRFSESELDNLVSNFRSGDQAMINPSKPEITAVTKPISDLKKGAKTFEEKAKEARQSLRSETRPARAMALRAEEREFKRLAHVKNLEARASAFTPIDLKVFNKILLTDGLSETEMHSQLKKALKNELRLGKELFGFSRVPSQFRVKKGAFGTGVALVGTGITLLGTTRVGQKMSERLDHSDRTIAGEKSSREQVKRQKSASALEI
jgi:hypothetical protein